MSYHNLCGYGSPSLIVAWLSFIALTLLWGFSFIAIRVTLELFPPFAAAAIRIFLAGLILMSVAFLKKRRILLSRKNIFQLMGIGMIYFGIAWACLFWGEQFVMPAVASIINSTLPIMVFVLSFKLLKNEKPMPMEFIGVGLGFVGILFVFVPSIQAFSLDQSVFYGMLAVMGMVVAYGFGTVLTRKMGAQISVYWGFVFQAMPAALFLFTLSFMFEPQSWMSLDAIRNHPRALWGIAYLAVFSTAIAWVLYFKLLHTWGALRASSVTYAMPVVSVFADWIFLKRLPTLYQLIGAGLILQAIYIMRWAQYRKMSAMPKLAEVKVKVASSS
ncbi:MAG: DMT family transporter [Bdellovibrionales bacterium]|nr:DMT family transporter [Bdellovibrionales bacterium]